MSLKVTEFLKIVVLLTEPPYSTPFLSERVQVIEKLANFSQEIVLFFYLDGLHQLNDSQFPRNFISLSDFYTNLHRKYPKILFYACSRCTAARGYMDLKKSKIDDNIFIPTKMLPWVSIVSIQKLGDFVAKGYRLIQI